MFPRPSNCQRCYAEALDNLKEELQRQRIRRRQIHETEEDLLRLTSKTTIYERHFGQGPVVHNFQKKGLCLQPKRQNSSTIIARKDTLNEDHTEEIPAVSRYETRESNDFEDEMSDSESQAKQEPQSGENSEEDDLSSHWSNSQVSVTRINSTLDNLLQGLATTSNLTLFNGPPKEKAPLRENTETIEDANEDNYTLKAIQSVPSKQSSLKQDATPERQMTKDIQETWNLMNALRQKIADVQNVIESNV